VLCSRSRASLRYPGLSEVVLAFVDDHARERLFEYLSVQYQGQELKACQGQLLGLMPRGGFPLTFERSTRCKVSVLLA
jgi:hypothetical protein